VFNGKLTITGSVTSQSIVGLLFTVFVGHLRFVHNGLLWTNLNEYTLDKTNTSIRIYISFIVVVFLCLLNICVALGFFVISVKIIKKLQSRFTLPFTLLFFHVCWMSLLNWSSINNVRFGRTMGPSFQVLKHSKFKLFFNVEPNPSTKLMAHVGSSSCQNVFNNIPKSI
jgi:hypothetical protein